ncbi:MULTISPECIES: antibiotic biosynthesis monooxygenase [Corallococcus]|uniref:antibiotic biosynthesis monooxygenase family protein n=1 Tax=Corallococcus TaxID=83461 RepID=UPI00117D7700|nr:MULTISPECIES: antibiotic biosynthesis monooxygenase family protein [Corallococcus]NBD07869.1 antibiotic biosynthesis monooxygenase [Corallococcus silvisoli]TSC33851.1 antibiotic biosynthesis monooxygenase [Corallococcus sp. Z5C101001]
MIVAISRFRTSPQDAEGWVHRLQERSRRVDGYPGFLGLEVLRSFEPSPEILLVTRWRDREAMKAYFQSEDFQRAKGASASQEGATFTLYEVVGT